MATFERSRAELPTKSFEERVRDAWKSYDTRVGDNGQMPIEKDIDPLLVEELCSIIQQVADEARRDVDINSMTKEELPTKSFEEWDEELKIRAAEVYAALWTAPAKFQDSQDEDIDRIYCALKQVADEARREKVRTLYGITPMSPTGEDGVAWVEAAKEMCSEVKARMDAYSETSIKPAQRKKISDEEK